MVVFLLTVLAVTKNELARGLIANRVQFITGLTISMDRVSVDVLNSRLTITNLRLHNPVSFRELYAAEIPRLSFAIDIPELFNRRVHITALSIDMLQLVIERSTDEIINIYRIRDIRRWRRNDILRAGGKSFITDFKIDTLDLKIERVVFRDITKDQKSFIKTYPLSLTERYFDITETESLIQLIVFQAVTKTAVNTFLNLDIYNMKFGLSRLLDSAQNLLPGPLRKTTEIIEKPLKELPGMRNIP